VGVFDQSIHILFRGFDATVTTKVRPEAGNADAGQLDNFTHHGQQIVGPDAFAQISQVGHDHDVMHQSPPESGFGTRVPAPHHPRKR
jgi:hypothetical protein